MKITTIMVFMFVFSLVVVAGSSLYNDLAASYGVTLNQNVSNSYNNIQDYYGDLSEVEDQIQGSDSAAVDSTDNNFITSVKSMWAAVQLFFNNFRFVTDLSNNISDDLGIPKVIIDVITGLILLSFIALIFSIAVRWKAD